MSFWIGFASGMAVMTPLAVCIGWFVGNRFTTKLYWNGFDRGYAQCEADREGLSAESAVRIYQ